MISIHIWPPSCRVSTGYIHVPDEALLGTGLRWAYNDAFGLVESCDGRVTELEVLFDELRRGECEPLREAHVLEDVRVEDFEEAQCCVARILNIMTWEAIFQESSCRRGRNGCSP